jgi:acyl carrier protein
MSSEIEKKVKYILSSVFNILVKDIQDTDNISPDTINSWDSLNHMNLVSALEEEFSLEFSDDEIVEMMNFKLINEIINQKLVS